MMQVFCEDVEPHVHEPWGYNPMQGFATALEAQYPAGMCEQLVRVFDETFMEKVSRCNLLSTNFRGVTSRLEGERLRS